MHIRQLTNEDHEPLDAMVRGFRDVADHSPFLEDPATITFVALDAGEVNG
ncbi:MAG TPA: hypothetical protein VH333_26645 [Pseudonocardiaceae bacterium]|nr:hypothetical protein [Pseudonocardiaceae bacterium]